MTYDVKLTNVFSLDMSHAMLRTFFTCSAFVFIIHVILI